MDIAKAGDNGFRERFLTRAQVERYRDRYTTGRRVRIDRMERAAMRALLRDHGRIPIALDIPCGTGRLSPVLAEFAERVVLADASPVMLEVAREEVRGLRTDPMRADIENIELPDRSVDLVFCHRLLHHVHDRQTRARILAELTRVSRRFVLMSYFTPGFRDRCRWWSGLVKGKSSASNRPLLRRRFLNEARSTGLGLVRSEPLRRFPLCAEFFLFERVED